MNDFLLKILAKLLTPEGLTSLVRKFLTLLGGIFIGRGWLTSGQWAEIAAVFVPLLAAWLWSFWQKLQKDKAIAIALGLPPKTTPTELKTVLKEEGVATL